ncbi:hypothetical protein [Salinisphaera sp. G21_0]|uniref:hypothetical protein n=1 Tax=Salinisphaera sp. G21_0 TaxID=2821094 RepID=UPI001ADA212B|nr:hypothetical protein [Salinisphaera sp. G21_0]MBO9484579.1 hypothetical protein [Salinisphaera sp. G21_0]
MLFGKVGISFNSDSIDTRGTLVAFDLFPGSGSCFALPPASMQSHALARLAGSSTQFSKSCFKAG